MKNQLVGKQYIAEKRRQRKRKNKIKNIIKNIVVGTILVVVAVLGTELFLRAWESEMDAHAEYNNKYQIDLRMKSYE